MKQVLGLVGVSLLWSAIASAQPKTADEWYKEGENQYNLGDFDKAADAFKQGFGLETADTKKLAFIFNIAQAYRQGNKCKDALFFYKRFLDMKDHGIGKPLTDEKRKDYENTITELDACTRTQEAQTKKPTDAAVATTPTAPTTGTKTETAAPVNTASTADAGATVGVTAHADKKAQPLVAARFEAGASKISAGDLSVPLQPTFSLIAGYPIQVNEKLRVDPGVAFGYKPVPYVNGFTNAKATGSMTQAMVNAAATYVVMPKVAARGDLGLGVLMFGGISAMGNPFTEGGAGTTGSLVMPAVRAAISADYELMPNLVATVTPFAFTYSPAKSGLRDDIKSIHSIDFLVGVGYRM